MPAAAIKKPFRCYPQPRQRPTLRAGHVDFWEAFNPESYPAHCQASMDYMPSLIRHEFTVLLALDEACSLSHPQMARFGALLMEYHRAVTPEDVARHRRKLREVTT